MVPIRDETIPEREKQTHSKMNDSSFLAPGPDKTSSLPLKSEAHLVGKSVEQQHGLSPSCIDLVPFHRNTGEATQPKVVYRAKLATMPAQGGASHQSGEPFKARRGLSEIS